MQIPDGWYSKDEIYNPDVDAKIINGKGNSLIVSVKSFPTSTKLTARRQIENTSNLAMEEQFNAVYGETYLDETSPAYGIMIASFEFANLYTH